MQLSRTGFAVRRGTDPDMIRVPRQSFETGRPDRGALFPRKSSTNSSGCRWRRWASQECEKLAASWLNAYSVHAAHRVARRCTAAIVPINIFHTRVNELRSSSMLRTLEETDLEHVIDLAAAMHDARAAVMGKL